MWHSPSDRDYHSYLFLERGIRWNSRPVPRVKAYALHRKRQQHREATFTRVYGRHSEASEYSIRTLTLIQDTCGPLPKIQAASSFLVRMSLRRVRICSRKLQALLTLSKSTLVPNLGVLSCHHSADGVRVHQGML